MFSNPLKVLNWSVFFQTQIFMLPIMLLFYQENGLTTGDYFLFQGIFSISALLMEVPAGYIADWISRKKILILSYCLFLCRLILWLFFGGYWIVLIGELLYSASKAFFSGVADGYIYDLLKAKGKTSGMLKSYGRLNFYMSVGTAIASLFGAMLYEEFGVLTLIGIEISFNSIGVLLLFLLPNVPPAEREKLTVSQKYKDLFKVAASVFKNDKIKYYVYYSAMVVAATMIFVWSFQPLIQTADLPKIFLGIIYFTNHAFRALASYLLQKTMSIFTFKSLGKTVYGLFICCFLGAIAIYHYQIKSVVLTFSILIFICFVIGLQLSFTLASVARIHALVSSAVRSTVASVNTMMSRFLTGVVLILFKFLLEDVDMQMAFCIYLALFLTSFYPLSKILKSPDEIKA